MSLGEITAVWAGLILELVFRVDHALEWIWKVVGRNAFRNRATTVAKSLRGWREEFILPIIGTQLTFRRIGASRVLRRFARQAIVGLLLILVFLFPPSQAQLGAAESGFILMLTLALPLLVGLFALRRCRISSASRSGPISFSSLPITLSCWSMFALLTGLPCLAQITSVTNNTSTPVPGSGHDYIQMLNETVNPANGAVSVRIGVPVPKARGLTLPFAFAYDSNGTHFVLDSGITGGMWRSNIGYLSRGGWSYSVPLLSLMTATVTHCDVEGQNCATCDYTTNYVFQDSSGMRHEFELASPPTVYPAGDLRCISAARLGGADAFFIATMDQTGLNQVNLFDLDGTNYNYGVHWTSVPGAGGTLYALPAFIEDRNGNKVTFTDSGNGAFSVVDTVGRTAFSSSGFGSSGNTLSVSGLSPSYAVSWGTASSNFTLGFTAVPGNICYNNGNGFPSQHSESQPVITAITLPNGQQYQFSYETTYGLLSQITYPTGGWIKYSWDINPQSEYGQYLFTNSQGTVNGVNNCIIDWFAVNHRYVSFDGTNIALQQDFSYSTTWNGADWTSKQTTVTTRDLVRGTSFVTTYVYDGFRMLPNDPYSGIPSALMPVEQTITYKDTTGQTLRTVAKQWADFSLLASEQTTLDNGSTAKKTYNYVFANPSQPFALVSETDEYDHGPGTPGPLLRKTNTNYASFPNTPFGALILDRPCQIIIYDGSNTRVAEQDMLYDGGASTCGAPGTPSVTGVSNLPSGTHDEVNYASSSTTPRGNLTSVARKCFLPSAQTCADAVSSFAYDETGRALSATDPLGHVTNYSYADSFTDTAPAINTNTYLTKITYPSTANGSVSHVEQFSYAYADGQLTKSLDQNGQATSYIYNDILRRLTEVDYPTQLVNGVPTASSKTLVYTDTPGSLSVQQNQQQDGSTTITDFRFFDNMGHMTGTKLLDPEGNVLTATNYDGLGRITTVTNPYRSTQDATYGVTTTQYDALGRATAVTHPDGSATNTTYVGRAVQIQAEGNGSTRVTRISQSDALGGLTSVCEVTGATQANGNTPSACGQDISAVGFLTTYQYDIPGNLTGVQQGGVARSFGYDSLSRLLTASNPESGTTTYSYDANGNVLTRTRPAPNQSNPQNTVTTTYQYDALNRLTATTYSDSVTPSISRHYDTSLELGRGLDNTIGRLSAEYVTSPSGQLLSGRVFSYDLMGRVIDNSQCTPQNCAGATTAFPITYGYDLLGKTLSASNGQGTTFSYSYNGAERLLTVTSNLSDSNHPGALFSATHYNPLGALKTASLGNGLYESYGYDTRGRLTSYVSSFTPPSAQVSYPRLAGPLWMAASLAKGEKNLEGPFLKHLALRDFVVVRAKGSILISGSSPRRKGKPGVVKVMIRPLDLVQQSLTITVPYHAGTTAVDIAWQLARRLEADAAFPLTATVRQIGSAAFIELVSREGGGRGRFAAEVFVISKQAVPSITATASGVAHNVPILLSDLRASEWVSQ